MEINTYKKILTEIFDALEFSEKEKSDAHTDFEQELAGALYEKTQNALSDEQKQWLKENGSSLKGDEPELLDVRETISSTYSNDDIKALSKPLFKEIVSEYIDYMSRDESDELKEKLESIATRL